MLEMSATDREVWTRVEQSPDEMIRDQEPEEGDTHQAWLTFPVPIGP